MENDAQAKFRWEDAINSMRKFQRGDSSEEEFRKELSKPEWTETELEVFYSLFPETKPASVAQ